MVASYGRSFLIFLFDQIVKTKAQKVTKAAQVTQLPHILQDIRGCHNDLVNRLPVLDHL